MTTPHIETIVCVRDQHIAELEQMIADHSAMLREWQRHAQVRWAESPAATAIRALAVEG